MTFRTKTFITIALILAFFILVQYYSSRRAVQQNYSSLERNYAIQNVKRINNILDDNISGLNAVAIDWASWDDTYSFVKNRNPQYAKSNLVPGTFATLKLNLILLMNNSHQVIYGTLFDLKTSKKSPLTPAMIRRLPIDELFSSSSKVKRAGIVSLPKDPMLIAANPVLTSQGRGPSRGMLIFGRFFDSSEVEHFGKLIDLPVKLVDCNSSKVPTDFAKARFLLSRQPIAVRTLGNCCLGGYTIVRDVFGKPGYIMRVSSPGTIFARSQASTLDFFTSILLIGLLFIALILTLLDRMVISPIVSLGSLINEISSLYEISSRITSPVKGELANLSQIVKETFDALKESSQKVQKSELQFHSVAQTASDAVVVMDCTGVIIHWNDAASRIFGYSTAEAIGKPIREIVPKISIQRRARQRVAEMKIVEKTVEMTGIRKGGSQFPVELSISRWQVAGERYFTIIARNISGRKKKERELEVYREQLEKLVEKRAAKIKGINKQLREEIEERKRTEEEKRWLNMQLGDEFKKQREISIALQEVFEPVSPPRLPNADLSTIYQSATEEAFVGGDFFDFITTDSASTAILLGDVSGKGIEASAQQLAARHFARSLLHLGISMDKLLLRLNEELFREMKPSLFVSLLFILYLPEGSLFWSSAGHPLPFILRRDGTVEQFPKKIGPPLGVIPTPSYETGIARLDRDDLLLGYTDGLLELKNNGEFFGEERICVYIRDHRSKKTSEMLKGLLKEAIKFGQGSLKDDLAMFCLKKL